MNLQRLINELELTVAAGRKRNMINQTSGCYIGDNLMHALANAKRSAAWITTTSSVNVAAVAASTRVSCVILAHGELPEGELVRACRRENISLFLSKKDVYTLVCALRDVETKHKFDQKIRDMLEKNSLYVAGDMKINALRRAANEIMA